MDNQHLAVMIRKSIETYGSKTAMRYKKGNLWEKISYKEMGEMIDAVAAGLLEYGVNDSDMVGIFSENRPEWAVADFSILSVKGVTVPIYATNTEKQVEYVLNDAKLKIVFAGTQSHYDKLFSLTGKSKVLEKIIVFDGSVHIQGSSSIYLKDFIRLGKESDKKEELDARLKDASLTDLATLIYTSGTTGDPKGVMLNHENFAFQFKALDINFNIDQKDKSLCFLPLSHAYERAWSYYVYKSGAENNYLSDPKKVIEYLSDVRPTAMVSVPRLYEKIYATVYDRIEKASGVKRKLFNWAVKTGSKYHYRKKDKLFIGKGLRAKYFLADKLILSKLRDVVGGPKNFFSAGGAPLSKEIEEFFFSAGLLICQGYGLTETSPMVTYNHPQSFKFGTVGKPIPFCEVKVDENGEILVKGKNVMQGYYNKPEATSEVMQGGWFRTGDVGIVDENGFVRITDRIKDIIITSQGKNIAHLKPKDHRLKLSPCSDNV
ncbi:MAG: long-chain fatty acid--CoA ligase, partial [Desulfobacteraceae bacterium]|nr:long-chain fatty acid--CoA ligase [Desulfobacteraceae bacterium]